MPDFTSISAVPFNLVIIRELVKRLGVIFDKVHFLSVYLVIDHSFIVNTYGPWVRVL